MLDPQTGDLVQITCSREILSLRARGSADFGDLDRLTGSYHTVLPASGTAPAGTVRLSRLATLLPTDDVTVVARPGEPCTVEATDEQLALIALERNRVEFPLRIKEIIDARTPAPKVVVAHDTDEQDESDLPRGRREFWVRPSMVRMGTAPEPRFYTGQTVLVTASPEQLQALGIGGRFARELSHQRTTVVEVRSQDVSVEGDPGQDDSEVSVTWWVNKEYLQPVEGDLTPGTGDTESAAAAQEMMTRAEHDRIIRDLVARTLQIAKEEDLCSETEKMLERLGLSLTMEHTFCVTLLVKGECGRMGRTASDGNARDVIQETVTDQEVIDLVTDSLSSGGLSRPSVELLEIKDITSERRST